MKTPLLAVASTQNSALSWKSPNSCLETRKPLPTSACAMPPSSSRQLALPIGSQLFRLEPSNRVVHPVSPAALWACQSMAEPERSRPMAIADRRFMFPPVVIRLEYRSRWLQTRFGLCDCTGPTGLTTWNAAEPSKPPADQEDIVRDLCWQDETDVEIIDELESPP